MKKLIYTLLLLAGSVHTYAQQINRNNFSNVDAYVTGLGPMHGNYLKFIVDTLTHRQTAPPEEMVRALYVWEAKNIAYNTNGHHHPKQNNTTPSFAINERKTTHEGYANLFQEMCRMARIKCVVIPGLAKNNARYIGKLDADKNAHTWNAVEIKGTWYLVDVTWGAGTTDRKVKFFTPEYTDAWFMTDRELFALNHYPKDKKWQLLDTPISKSVFMSAPIVGTSAIVNEVYPPDGVRGSLRSKADTSKKLAFEIGDPKLIQSVTASAKTTKRIPAKYTIENNTMYVDVPTPIQGNYDINIYINDALAYTYNAEVGKARPKPKPKPQPKPKAPAAGATKAAAAAAPATTKSSSGKMSKKAKAKAEYEAKKAAEAGEAPEQAAGKTKKTGKKTKAKAETSNTEPSPYAGMTKQQVKAAKEKERAAAAKEKEAERKAAQTAAAKARIAADKEKAAAQREAAKMKAAEQREKEAAKKAEAKAKAAEQKEKEAAKLAEAKAKAAEKKAKEAEKAAAKKAKEKEEADRKKAKNK